MQDESDFQQACYFCKEQDIGACVTRSLYHKYNDSSNKLLQRIQQIMHFGKQRPVGLRKYEEIKHIVDDSQHINKFMKSSKASTQLLDLLEYYKYRKFVPLFAKNLDNIKMTEQLHVYYYDKLKFYYNQIKKQLNITIDPSSASESEQSLITKTEIAQDQSRILQQFKSKLSKQSIRQFQTQSKAFEDLLNILKKNEDRLKKIKSLKTQDCTRQSNPFKDNMQKTTNLLSYLTPQTRTMMKKGRKVFFRYIQDAKSQTKNIQTLSKYKSIKKIGQSSKASLFYQAIKSKSNSESIYKFKKQTPKLNTAHHQKQTSRNKALIQKSQRRISENHTLQKSQKQIVKSLPKVLMNFNIRPSRSFSSTSVGHPHPQNNKNHRLSSKNLINNKQGQVVEKIYSARIPESKGDTERKKKQFNKSPGKIGPQIDQNDNLASINRKKIQELKLKSQRKKQGRK